MFGEYKYSVWSLSVKLFLTYLGTIFINLLVTVGLLGLFSEESMAWNWFVQFIALLLNFVIVYLFAGGEGKRDIMVDSANEKRAQRHEGFTYEDKFDIRKGFIAGAIVQVPAILLFIAWAISGVQGNVFSIFVNLFYSPYFEFKTIIGLNVLSLILFTIIYSAVTGLSYMSAKSYRKKILTIIKRNEEKASAKGIVKK